MTLHEDSIEWAVKFLSRHSDGDIFPPVPELTALSACSEDLIAAFVNRPLRSTFPPQPFRRFVVPKE